MSDERRVRIYWLPEYEILDLFFSRGRLPDIIQLPIAANLPDGARILRVCHAWDRMAFGFMVEHESFGVVPDGGIPDWGPQLEYHCVKVGEEIDAARREGYEQGKADAEKAWRESLG